MRITYDETYEGPLAIFGSELVQMIKGGDYDRISDRFGYALAFDRPPADAIAVAIKRCLTGDGRSAVINLDAEARILVKYFKQPNSINLFGLVECFLPLDQDEGEMLAELIVATAEGKFHVGLEDISYAAP
ncbi:hypothetical protein [Pinirhizobacter soli]|uniref:hypothetical protein n=1 Tax=Pinirhizobacter soli TaxID=2786953 RepID=UPI00202A3746|nr:hypothetical protein [Pinirhizobacter soli]